MKSLIHDLIQNPILVFLVIGFFLIYLSLTLHFLIKNKNFSQRFETSIFVLFVLLLSGVAITPFTLINPAALTTHPSIRPASSFILQLVIYAFILILLSVRFRYTLKDSLSVLSVLIVKAPFFCLLLLTIGLSALWSDTPGFTLKASAAFLGTTVFSIYIAKQNTWENLTKILRWSQTLICLSSIAYSVLKPSIGVGIKGWKGILGHENQLGALMALMVILWLLYADRNRKDIWKSLIFILLALLVLQNAHTAGAKVILIILISLLGFLRSIKNLSFQWAFVAVVLFLVLSSSATLLITENLASILGALGKDMTLTGRTQIWPYIIDAIKRRPLVGYGFYGFWQSWRGLDNPAYDVISPFGWRPPHAHNGFLDIGLHIGLLGILFFFLSFLTNLAKGVRYMSRSKTPESILPLVLLTYTILTTLSETGLLDFTNAWFYHVLCSVRFSLDNPRSQFNKNSQGDANSELRMKASTE